MNLFSHVPAPKVKRSTFNLSHDVKLTTEFGSVVPFMCEEVVPNDTWKVDSEVLVRLAPMYAPVMDKMNVYVHYWYVPFRIIWDDYATFITGENEAKDPPQEPPTFPVLRLLDGREGSDYYDANGLWHHGTLADYLNYPTSEEVQEGGGMYVSQLPFRAYQTIWNEYYRDENLQEDLNIGKGSTVLQPTDAEYLKLLTLRNRAWAKDYFTSALPNVQKGPTQPVPVTGYGVVAESEHPTFTRFVDGTHPAQPDKVYYGVSSDEFPLGSSRDLFIKNFLQSESGQSPTDTAGLAAGSSAAGSGFIAANLDNSKHLDLSGVEVILKEMGFTINDLRRSNAIQRWLERNARGGSRYIEMLLMHFGVISDDLQLQRPEFLGGGKCRIKVGDVLQTSESSYDSPLAQYSGVGRGWSSQNHFKRTFKERGYIIATLNIQPKATYMEGLPRAYRKFDKFDYYFPEFARLGEQEVYNYELALRGLNHQDVFGYAPRYAEYKYIPSRVHGDFKNIQGLGYWTLARHYAEQPALTEDFITCDADKDNLNRIFAYKTGIGATSHHFFVQIHNEIKARRPMPYLPDPSL